MSFSLVAILYALKEQIACWMGPQPSQVYPCTLRMFHRFEQGFKVVCVIKKSTSCCFFPLPSSTPTFWRSKASSTTSLTTKLNKNGEPEHPCETPPVVSKELGISLYTFTLPHICKYIARRRLTNFTDMELRYIYIYIVLLRRQWAYDSF